jgi:hypothetical protein
MVDIQHIKNNKRTNKLKSLISPFLGIGALGANRTRDTRIRNPVLYPLSYEGWWNIQIWRNNTQVLPKRNPFSMSGPEICRWERLCFLLGTGRSGNLAVGE